MSDAALFWVAELVDPVTGLPFTPAVYWCGDTKPVFVPVTTIDIQGALKFRDAAACQAQIDRCGPCKRGVLRPMEHAWAPDETPAETPDETPAETPDETPAETPDEAAFRRMWQRSNVELSPLTVETLKRVCPPVEPAP